MAILTIDLQNRVTDGTSLGTTWTMDAPVRTAVRQTVIYQHAQPTSRV